MRSHVKKILRKLGVRSRGEAIEVARRLREDLLSAGGSATRAG